MFLAGGARPGSCGRLVVKLGGMSKRAELQQQAPSPPPELPPYDIEGVASAALLRDLHRCVRDGQGKHGYRFTGKRICLQYMVLTTERIVHRIM